jgi:chemotaxis protein MotB
MFLACVSKNKYLELETELNHTQGQLADLQSHNQILQNENGRLIEAVEGLRLELQQERLVASQKEEEIYELRKTRRKIETRLKQQIAQKEVKIEEKAGDLKIIFTDKIIFDSGSVWINSKGREVLLRLADSLREKKNLYIVVTSHTDNVQIGSALQERFPTNWELSATRAAAVVRFLQEKGNIAPERLSAIGYSFYRPVSTNDSEEGREQNRRIEIILFPQQ